MPKLRIDLQDGFQDDDVVVKVDGEERLRQTGVTTKKVLGLAGSVTVDVPEGQRSIELSVPGRGVTKQIDVDTQKTTHVGLSLAGQEVTVLARDKPFGYG
jgi:hypothetical protein